MNQSVQPSPYKIFISYRRTDSQATVDHIYEWLVRAFGRDVIFKDVDSIPRGYQFAPYIEHVMRQCRVVLVVLGPSWPSVLATEGAYSGQPRLVDPEDHVRIEVEQALTLAPVDTSGRPTGSLLLIPLLVQNALMPRTEDLPASLQSLRGRNASQVRHDPDFSHDMQRLIGDCARWMGVVASDPSGSYAPASLRPPDPVDEMLVASVPQIRAAFSAQDWPRVIRLANFLPRQTSADRVPTEVYQMWGRALLAERDYTGAKVAWDTVRRREPRDVAALRAASEARVGLDTPDELTEALALLDGAMMFTNGNSQQLGALLRMYAQILRTLIHQEKDTATAQKHWRELLRVSDEGLSRAGSDDAGWLSAKLDALEGLERYDEAVTVARALSARPDTTVTRLLARARLVWIGEDGPPGQEISTALDAAHRLAPNDKAIAMARQQWLVLLPPGRFPPRLDQLGFVATKHHGIPYIIPPVYQASAGEFLMGSDPRRDRQAGVDEQPQHRVNLATFSIARFPVTVAEYACFVEAGQRSPGEWQNQLQKLDHPVTFVSWDDAVAYVSWLAKLTGQPWRLPTEAEWEKTARWDVRTRVAGLYPWGDAFGVRRCNTYESYKGGTTAVGSYPNGLSPYGAEEMAGNVWEWTHSLYKPYPYTPSDGREVEHSTEIRVLRGGSWYFNSQYARAASRFQYRPDFLNNNIGFRLVLGGPRSA